MSVGKRLRFEVFKRDKFTCQYCGRRPPNVMLVIDHIVPLREGGRDDFANLVTSCEPCNSGKSGVSLGETAPPLDQDVLVVYAQEILEKRQAIEESAAAAEEYRAAIDEAVETVLCWWEDRFGTTQHVGCASIRTFLRELRMAQIAWAIDETASRLEFLERYELNHWKYFCKVCWNLIRRNGQA